jgi:hypothetical protein
VNLKDDSPNELKQIDIHNLKTFTFPRKLEEKLESNALQYFTCETKCNTYDLQESKIR